MDDPPVIRSLKGDYAFRRLRKGRSGHAKHLSLRYLPAPGAPGQLELRVGIVVSKKVGKAVVRNRVRRRLREALREVSKREASQPPRLRPLAGDLMLIARPEAAEASYAELRRSLEQALAKVARP